MSINLQSYITWLKAHERLVVILALSLFAVHFTGKAYDYLVKHDQTQAQIANTQAKAAADKTDADQQRNLQTLAQLAQLQNSFNSLSVQLSQSMQQRTARTIQQKQSDDTAAPAELASRIRVLSGVGNISVSAPNGDSLVFSLDAAHKVADDEEDLVKATQDVKDLNTGLQACQQLTGKQNDAIAGLKTQVADGQVALTAEQKAHKDDVKTLKAEKRGAYVTGAKIGGVVAVIAVEVVRIFLIHKP